jgi:hypothetical protein
MRSREVVPTSESRYLFQTRLERMEVLGSGRRLLALDALICPSRGSDDRGAK